MSQSEQPFGLGSRRLGSYTRSGATSMPEFEVIKGVEVHLQAIESVLQTAAERVLDVFLTTGSLDSQATDARFMEHCGKRSLSSMLRNVVEAGGNVSILIAAALPGNPGEPVQVSPGIRDLLLIPARAKNEPRPVTIRSLGFDPVEGDSIVHNTIATNVRRTQHGPEWYVRVEAFHEPSDLSALTGLYLSNTASAAKLGAKLLGDFDRLFEAAGRRAKSGNSEGVMRLNGDQSYVVRKSAKIGSPVVAPA